MLALLQSQLTSALGGFSLARLKQTHINIQYLVGGSRFSFAKVVDFAQAIVVRVVTGL